MSRFTTANEVKAVTAHEVINRSKPERENSSSVFHIHQQRAWQQCQTSKDKSEDFIENKVAERA